MEKLEEKDNAIAELKEIIASQNKEIMKLTELNNNQRGTITALLGIISSKSDVIEESDTRLEDFLGRQKRIFQNKVNHGFNTTNIYQEARYILEETAELMRAIEKNDRENMIEELADIVIFAYGCTEVARLGDLDTKIFSKMKINEQREYKQNSEGDFVKTGNLEDTEND